jgi:hypothetical protein
MNLKVNTNKHVIFVEDFDYDNDPKFVEGILKPYLKDIYKDLKLRVPKGHTGLNKALVIEYLRLPEVITNQIFEITAADGVDMGEQEFIKFLIRVYVSPIEERMKLSFDLFDFNKDTKVS